MIDIVESDNSGIVFRVDLYAMTPYQRERMREIARDGLVTDEELVEIVSASMTEERLAKQQERVDLLKTKAYELMHKDLADRLSGKRRRTKSPARRQRVIFFGILLPPTIIALIALIYFL